MAIGQDLPLSEYEIQEDSTKKKKMVSNKSGTIKTKRTT
jgi:hypothetical protein